MCWTGDIETIILKYLGLERHDYLAANTEEFLKITNSVAHSHTEVVANHDHTGCNSL